VRVVSYLWIVPAAVAVVGLAGLAGLARRAAGEAVGLQREVGRWAELRPAVVETRDAAAELRAAARRLGR
jgi:hypothetical protein